MLDNKFELDGIVQYYKTEQMVKIFEEKGREKAINAVIAEGWRVVQMTSCVGGWNYGSYNFFITILFEREAK
jgi:hypothetical protein